MKLITRGVPSALLVLLASSSAHAAVPVVQITQPQANQAVGDSLAVKATASGDFTITAVNAQVGALATPLSFSGGNYTGQLDISTLPIGPISLTVTATDATAQSGAATLNLVHDHAPTLAVLTPEGAVARPTLRLRATCTDLDIYGCATIKATVVDGPELVSVNAAALDQTVSLSAYLDKAVAIDIVATDTAGASTTRRINAYVDATATLAEVARGDGPIVDFDDTRILFGLPGSLVIRARSGGAADVTIPNVAVAPGAAISTGFLTPLGAIWLGGELRDGATLTNNAQSGLVSRSGYAVWKTGTAGSNPAGYYRDVAADSTTLAVQAGYDVPEADVAANGDAVFMWMPPAATAAVLSRRRAGVTTQLTTVLYPQRPVTDGINVAYARHQSTGRGPIKLLTVAGEIELAVNQPLAFGAAVPGRDYAVAGGWAAYTENLNNQLVVYTRSPEGTVALASPFAAATTIDALSASGEVMYIVSQPDGKRRYRGAAGAGVPELVTNHQLGTARAVGTDWYLTLGASLLKLGPAPDLDAGTDAGGEEDAATSSSSSSGAASSSGGGASSSGGGASSSSGSSSGGAATSSGATTSSGGVADAGTSGGSSGDASDADGGGCSTTGTGSGSWLGLFGVVLGLVGLRRVSRARR